MTEPRTDLLEPYEGFGKYEGELNLCEVLDGLDADEEAGDVEVEGLYRLYRWSSAPEQAIRDIGGTTGDIVAAILRTSDQGFVTAEYYESYEEANEAWHEIEVDIEEAYEASKSEEADDTESE